MWKQKIKVKTGGLQMMIFLDATNRQLNGTTEGVAFYHFALSFLFNNN